MISLGYLIELCEATSNETNLRSIEQQPSQVSVAPLFICSGHLKQCLKVYAISYLQSEFRTSFHKSQSSYTSSICSHHHTQTSHVYSCWVMFGSSLGCNSFSLSLVLRCTIFLVRRTISICGFSKYLRSGYRSIKSNDSSVLSALGYLAPMGQI